MAFRVARTLKNGSMRAWDESQRTTYYRAMARFVPTGIKAEILCVVCEDSAARPEYARTVAVHREHRRYATVPGNHASCISEHAATLADRLNEALPFSSSVISADFYGLLPLALPGGTICSFTVSASQASQPVSNGGWRWISTDLGLKPKWN